MKRDDRREQRMPAVKRDDGLPALVRFVIDDQRGGAKRGETVEGGEKLLAGGVRGREGENRKSRPDDSRRSVQHFGRRERFGVNGRGFLELERRLGGDGVGRAATNDEQGSGFGQRLDRRRRGRRGGRQVQDRRQLGERGEKLAILAPVGHE